MRGQLGVGAKVAPMVIKAGSAKERVLRSAVEKLVQHAAKAGITIDDLIHLLDSGMEVRELFDYVMSKMAAAA